SDYRDLYSFPTRRSSDLDELSKEVDELKIILNVGFEKLAEQVNVITEQVNSTEEKSHMLEANLDRLVIQFARMVKTTERLLNRVDRKSTRLNSSHVSISY